MNVIRIFPLSKNYNKNLLKVAFNLQYWIACSSLENEHFEPIVLPPPF